jgi:hypothetical protein
LLLGAVSEALTETTSHLSLPLRFSMGYINALPFFSFPLLVVRYPSLIYYIFIYYLPHLSLNYGFS